MKLSCCIVAAGMGTRLGDEWADLPKAMVPLLGRAMLYYSLNAFDQAGRIDRFVVTTPPDAIDEFRGEIKIWGFSRPVTVVAGGETRAESVLFALRELGDDPPDMVLIHDCARPCVTAEMVRTLIEESKDGAAATLAHPATDTLRTIADNCISGEVNRSEISCIETPQVFPYKRILELHEQGGNVDKNSDAPPDDTTLFTRAGESVRIIIHEGSNLKVTYAEDIAAAEGVLFQRGWQDVSEGED